jgi:CheY-like chemotaxis protein
MDAKLANAAIFTILQQLKTAPATHALPVIVITDDPQKFHRADAFVATAQINHDLRPLVLKSLGLSEPVEAVPMKPATVT